MSSTTIIIKGDQDQKQHMGKMNDTILEVKDLSVTFTQYERGFSRRTIHAVEKMDLEIKSGEIVAVVGSSGSGKSLLAHAIMGILPYNSEMDGEIRFLHHRRGDQDTPRHAAGELKWVFSPDIRG